MFEQHIITDQDRRAHSEGKIAISPNYKAGHDPYLSITSNNSVGWLSVRVAGNISVQVVINITNIAKGQPNRTHWQQYNQLAEECSQQDFSLLQVFKSPIVKIKMIDLKSKKKKAIVFHFHVPYTDPRGCYYVLLKGKCWVGLLFNSWASASVCVSSCHSPSDRTQCVCASVCTRLWKRVRSLSPDEYFDRLPHINKISSISLSLVRVPGLQSSLLLLPSFSSSRWPSASLFFCNCITCC